MTTTQSTKKALIVGLGISGISSAIALKRAGWEPTIVEKAPTRRKGGYFIGLFGLGRTAAEHLGALDGLHDRRSPASQNFAIDRNGITGDTLGFADAPADFGPWMMLRGDVEEATFNALPEDVEIRYNTRPVDIWQNASGVRVTLENSATGARTDEKYDLLVGADGTLYSGMGATTGIGGADLLGAALRKDPDDIDAALNNWERVLRPKVAEFQKQGAAMGRKNFVSITQDELDKRNKSVTRRRRMIKSPVLGTVFKHSPFIKNRNADLTALL